MENLRSAILASRTLEARQEIEDLLARGRLVHEVLADLYYCAAHHAELAADPTNGPLPPTTPATVVVYSLERNVHELARLGQLGRAAGHVATHLCRAAKRATPPSADGAASNGSAAADPSPALITSFVRDGRADDLAALLLGLEDARREEAIRHALLSWSLDQLGERAGCIVFLNAFLHGFERGGRGERAVLASHAARRFVARNEAAPQLEELFTRAPPLPGACSAGALLQRLREFHGAAAMASLHALCAGGRGDEAMTVLLARSEENAGPRWEHLLFADAVRDLTHRLPPGRHLDALVRVARRLLLRPREQLVTSALSGRDIEKPRNARDRQRRERDLDDALLRSDRDLATEAALALLADEQGAVRRALVEHACRIAEERVLPAAFVAAMTCLALAVHSGWPAGRSSLLRGIVALAGETRDAGSDAPLTAH